MDIERDIEREKHAHSWTDRQTDGRTDGQTEGETEGETRFKGKYKEMLASSLNAQDCRGIVSAAKAMKVLWLCQDAVSAGLFMKEAHSCLSHP